MTDTPAPSRRAIIGLLGSTGCSVTGNAMVTVLIPWLVLRETGNAAYAGLVNAAALGAATVSLVFGAAVLDRWDRRNLSVGADLLSAVAVAAVPLVDVVVGLSMPSIVFLVVVGALFDGPGRSAREALRPDIATRSGLSLERTNALGEVTDGIGFIVGPAAAGVAVAIIGLAPSFWLAAGILAVAGVLFLATLRPSVPRPPSDDADESYLRATLEGVKLVWRDPVLRATAVATSLFGVTLAPIVLVFTATFEVDGRSAALGGLLAAFSIGSIGGALGYAAIGERLRRRPVMLVGLIGASTGILIMAVLLDRYGPLVAVVVVTGLVAGPIGPIFSVIIQQRTEDAFRGRVLATLGTVELVAAPLSLAIAGVVIEAASPAVALTALGIGLLAASAYVVATPGLRRIEAEDLAP